MQRPYQKNMTKILQVNITAGCSEVLRCALGAVMPGTCALKLVCIVFQRNVSSRGGQGAFLLSLVTVGTL